MVVKRVKLWRATPASHIRVLVGDPSALPPLQVPADAPAKQMDNAQSTCVPDACVGDLEQERKRHRSIPSACFTSHWGSNGLLHVGSDFYSENLFTDRRGSVTVRFPSMEPLEPIKSGSKSVGFSC